MTQCNGKNKTINKTLIEIVKCVQLKSLKSNENVLPNIRFDAIFMLNQILMFKVNKVKIIRCIIACIYIYAL